MHTALHSQILKVGRTANATKLCKTPILKFFGAFYPHQHGRCKITLGGFIWGYYPAGDTSDWKHMFKASWSFEVKEQIFSLTSFWGGKYWTSNRILKNLSSVSKHFGESLSCLRGIWDAMFYARPPDEWAAILRCVSTSSSTVRRFEYFGTCCLVFFQEVQSLILFKSQIHESMDSSKRTNRWTRIGKAFYIQTADLLILSSSEKIKRSADYIIH